MQGKSNVINPADFREQDGVEPTLEGAAELVERGELSLQPWDINLCSPVCDLIAGHIGKHQVCDCAPEDGDFGSGFHFEWCPKAETQKVKS